MNGRTNALIREILNYILAVSVFASWLWMVFGFRSGNYAATGLRSLRYFTVLSNLLEGFASVYYIYAYKTRKITHSLLRLKYVAMIALMVTFLVVVVFLGPLMGYPMMYVGANLWFHLLIPLLALAEFLILDQEEYTRTDTLYTLIPLLLYGFGYLTNILVNGVGVHSANDWYRFFSWGIPVGILILCVIVGLTWVISTLFRILSQKIRLRG